MAPGKLQRSMRRRAPRRERLLDAAELLFAESGYRHVSLKQISERSSVNVGLINYYFGTKEKLLHDVLARRAADFTDRINRGYDRFTEALPTIENPFAALLRTHFLPLITAAVGDDPGERAYVRLMAEPDMWRSGDIHAAAPELWQAWMRLFDQAQICFDGVDQDRTRLALYMACITISGLLCDGWFLEQVSGGKYHAGNVDEMFALAEEFLDGGAERLALGRKG